MLNRPFGRTVTVLPVLPVLPLMAAAALLAPLPGCDGADSAPVETNVPAVAPRVDRYTDVRGVISSLPVTDDPRSSLRIRHERLPSFKSAGGEVVGMAAMTMPFPVDDAAVLEGLSEGDAVRFDFETRVRGANDFSYAVTAIRADAAGEPDDADPDG